ncbi:hypothetical protein O1611_g3513 [Lasiodiplodia mahajangana]|uniref:Uncharacterized protein n=1 Tax=Lasiodiplodia mahajangana TaxID=1108764 RepID=A0ACC2JRI1_9PEZI|nr:hypothetical protein O1611_g3513 [Lasiodiplodia mahajangana]
MPQSPGSLSVCLYHVDNEEAFKGEKAFELYVPINPNLPKSNISFKAFSGIPVRQVRHRGLSHFSLDANGFQYLQHVFNDGLSMEQIQAPDGEHWVQQYLLSLHPILMAQLKAKQIILYDYRVRELDSDYASFPRLATRQLELPPARWVHADESAQGGRQTIREHLVDQEHTEFGNAEGRFRIMNIWRPLVPIIKERPLALCDWSTVVSDDWELCDQIHHDRVDEAMYLKRRGHHEWWWLSDQTCDELAMFVVWDSDKFAKGVQASTPHAAFELPGTSGEHGRQSIEVSWSVSMHQVQVILTLHGSNGLVEELGEIREFRYRVLKAGRDSLLDPLQGPPTGTPTGTPYQDTPTT